jgi:cell division protease FtsH
VAGVLADPGKRPLAAQILGQAFMRAYHVVKANREAVDHVADVLSERKEMYGDEVVELLDSQNLHEPEIDLLDDSAWPKL